MAHDLLNRLGLDAPYPNGFDAAFVGLGLSILDGAWKAKFRYSADAIVRCLMSPAHGSMSREDAWEFFYANIECAIPEGDITWVYDEGESDENLEF